MPVLNRRAVNRTYNRVGRKLSSSEYRIKRVRKYRKIRLGNSVMRSLSRSGIGRRILILLGR